MGNLTTSRSGRALGLLLACWLLACLAGCGPRAQALLGLPLPVPASLAGTWRVQEDDVGGIRAQALDVEVTEGAFASLRWQADNAQGLPPVRAYVRQLGSQQVLFVETGDSKGGYYFAAMSVVNDHEIVLTAPNEKRLKKAAKALGDKMKYQSHWLHREAHLDGAVLEKLLEQKSGELFTDGVRVRLLKAGR